jgi:hypothetical protein
VVRLIRVCSELFPRVTHTDNRSSAARLPGTNRKTSLSHRLRFNWHRSMTGVYDSGDMCGARTGCWNARQCMLNDSDRLEYIYQVTSM